MTNNNPRDQKAVSTPLAYIYQILGDRTIFDDSSSFVPGHTARRKERTSLLPGIGAMISESTSVGHVFSSCSLGIGAIEEKIQHIQLGLSKKKGTARILFLAC